MITPKIFFATCPKNLEGLLEEELSLLGACTTKQTLAGVKFTGDLELAYRACLWSRLANRILLPLAEFSAASADALYEGVRKIKWTDHLQPTGSFMVDFIGVSAAIKNSHFGALKVKDAIVDQIRACAGKRPDINKDNPDLRINVYLYRDLVTISIDLSGDSLHRRSYRSCPGIAPLKENLAAAILYRSNWPKLAETGMSLLDPMCGSGTILVEAAMMAQDHAPNFLRKSFGFSKWLNHDKSIWQRLYAEAEERGQIGAKKFTGSICGCDIAADSILAAKMHIKNAKMENAAKVNVSEIKQLSLAGFAITQPGIIVTNPPYGKRLCEVEHLVELYRDFGGALRANFLDWQVALFTGNPELGKNMGIKSVKQYSFFNGTIPCKLLLFNVVPSMFWREYRGLREIVS